MRESDDFKSTYLESNAFLGETVAALHRLARCGLLKSGLGGFGLLLSVDAVFPAQHRTGKIFKIREPATVKSDEGLLLIQGPSCEY